MQKLGLGTPTDWGFVVLTHFQFELRYSNPTCCGLLYICTILYNDTRFLWFRKPTVFGDSTVWKKTCPTFLAVKQVLHILLLISLHLDEESQG